MTSPPQACLVDFPEFGHREVISLVQGGQVTSCTLGGQMHESALPAAIAGDRSDGSKSPSAAWACTAGLLLEVARGRQLSHARKIERCMDTLCPAPESNPAPFDYSA